MTLAVLGTGIMGAAMVRNWLAAGESVRVWNRTRERAEPLAAAGAVVADHPAGAVDGADTVVTMLYDADSVAAAVTAAEPAMPPGTMWVQMSTVGLPGVDRLADLADRYALRYVDAPVIGTRQPAEQGRLTVLASGPAEARSPVEELLAPVSARVHWLGPAGAGSRTKLVVNTWVLTAVAGLAQTIALADGLEVDPALFLELIRGGPLDQAYAHVKGAAMIKRQYPASFPVSGAVKDTGLITKVAASVGLDTSIMDAIGRLLGAAAGRGFGDDDLAAIFEAVRDPAGAADSIR